MVVFFIVTLISVAFLIFLITVGIFLGENDGILNDQIISDYLDKLGDKFSVYHSEYYDRIDPTYPAKVNRSIEKSPPAIRLVFPYYIEYVGTIPVWSKSKPRIDAMFATGTKSNWKRKKLGLE